MVLKGEGDGGCGVWVDGVHSESIMRRGKEKGEGRGVGRGGEERDEGGEENSHIPLT